MNDFKSRTSTKGLKKIDKNRWFDPNSRLEFTKNKNGTLKMEIPKFDKQWQRQTNAKVKRYESKLNYNKDGKVKNITQYRYEQLKKAVDKWNKGEITRANTVGRVYKEWENEVKATNRFYSKDNPLLIPMIEEKKKVQYMRILGVHGVYNGKAFDDLIRTFAKTLQMNEEELKNILFPKGLEECSSYEDFSEKASEVQRTIDELIDDKVKDRIINENEAFFLREKMTDIDINLEGFLND